MPGSRDIGRGTRTLRGRSRRCTMGPHDECSAASRVARCRRVQRRRGGQTVRPGRVLPLRAPGRRRELRAGSVGPSAKFVGRHAYGAVASSDAARACRLAALIRGRPRGHQITPLRHGWRKVERASGDGGGGKVYGAAHYGDRVSILKKSEHSASVQSPTNILIKRLLVCRAESDRRPTGSARLPAGRAPKSIGGS